MRTNLLTVAAIAAGAVLLAAASQGATTIAIGSGMGAPGDVVPFDVTLTTDAEVAGTQNDIAFDQAAKVARTCSKTTDTLCVEDTECPAGKCSKTTATSCRITGECPSGTCSVTTTTACHVNVDCPAGTCSTTTTKACRVTSECPATETCQNTETCTNGETCRNAETCSGVACVVNGDLNKGGTAFAFQPSGCEGDACTGVRALVLSLSNVDPIPSDSVLYTCRVQIASDAAGGDDPLTCSNAGASDPGGIAINGCKGGANDGQACVKNSDCTGGTCVTAVVCTNGKITVEGGGPPSSTLASAITATDAIIPLTDASAFPDRGTIQIGDEQILYTGKEGNNLTGAERGILGTTAADHAAGATATIFVVPPVPTPTVTPTSTPSITPTPASTNTVASTATVTRTGTQTARPSNTPGGKGNDDDGCAVVAPAHASNGWMLLLPAAALLWLRRRTK